VGVPASVALLMIGIAAGLVGEAVVEVVASH
jgi:hypothetical protein